MSDSAERPGMRWTGNGWTQRMRIWCCPLCARTVKCPEIYYAKPNTLCTCQSPRHVTAMVEVTK